jgi:hypothetical protein
MLIICIHSLGIPDFHKGRSYVSFSPDGKYRMDNVFLAQFEPVLFVLTRLDDQRIVRIDSVALNNLEIIRDTWLCEDWEQDSRGVWNGKRIPCYGYSYGDEDITIQLPPSWFEKILAWLAVEAKRLAVSQLEIIKINPSYPPITEEIVIQKFPNP